MLFSLWFKHILFMTEQTALQTAFTPLLDSFLAVCISVLVLSFLIFLNIQWVLICVLLLQTGYKIHILHSFVNFKSLAKSDNSHQCCITFCSLVSYNLDKLYTLVLEQTSEVFILYSAGG